MATYSRHPAAPTAHRILLAVLVAAVLACMPQGLTAPSARAFGVALQTGVSADPTGPEIGQALTQAYALGGRFQRLTFSWRAIAPATPPPGFQPTNPNDRSYHWARVDRVIAETIAHGLTPYVSINEPPSWAQAPPGSSEKSPDPNQLAMFAQAFATRYNGSQPSLPWVRYWEVWNEPNTNFFLLPQLQGEQIVSIANYRTLLNDSAAAIHQANPQNIVIGGALFPNGQRRVAVTTISPMEFTRGLFCLSGGAHPRRICDATVHADIWSVHPYTTGGPSTLPANPDNIWIANLQSLTKLVQTAQRLGALVSAQPVQTWVTEFGWGSSPLAPRGVPLALEQRWVAETLHRAWSAGISQFSWYELHDEALGSANPNPYGGLYFQCAQGVYCDRAKPAAAAFRFPFVSYLTAKRRVLVWGRIPGGAPGAVQVQWLLGHRWRGLVKLKTDPNGIFTARPKLPRAANPKSAILRAVLLGDPAASPPFSLRRTPDIAVTPFGT